MKVDPQRRPGFAIARTSYLFRKRIIEELKHVGSALSPGEAWILMVLQDAGGSLQTGALRESMLRDSSTLTRQLDSACRKKLVRRERDRDDGRVINIVVTATGRRELERLMPLSKNVRESAVSGIPKEHLRIMVDTLLKIQENLQSI